MAEEKSIPLLTLKDTHLYYTSIAKPVLLKDAKDKGIHFDPENPTKNTEWVVKSAIPEKVFKALKKKFKKCSNLPHAKEYTLEEFKEIFHADSEMPDFGEGVEDVVVVKFSQRCESKAGKPMTQPTVIGIKGKVQDRNGLEVNKDVLLGNGTKAHVQLRPVDFGEHGVYLYPQAVCVTELVEYGEASGSSEVDLEAFDLEELDEVSVEEDEEDMFGDIPF